ncbi:TPA: hypothetical protein ACX3MJ_005855, partial [Raoultella ornithinolytica]
IRWYYILFLYFHLITVDCNTLRITRINEKSHFSHLIHAVAMKSRLRMVYDHLRGKKLSFWLRDLRRLRSIGDEKASLTASFMLA